MDFFVPLHKITNSLNNMTEKKTSLARRITRRILVWTAIVMVCLACFIFYFAPWATREFYTDSYHNKMLITTEYTRRVISDVYVAVTNNLYYIEHNLGNPDYHKDVMARIVKNGTRVRSCGISFIEDYYPERGHRFCPFAWRNAHNPNEVTAINMGDSAYNYLTADWFTQAIEADSTIWSDPFYDGYDMKTPLTAYMVPVHDLTGRTVAVLGADVSLDWLTNKLNETDSTINKNASFVSEVLGLKSTSFIVNHDGTFITHPDADRILRDSFLKHIEADDSDIEQLADNLSQGRTSTEEKLTKFVYEGRECYFFYTPVKYTNWMVVTVVPWQSIDVLGIINGAILLAIFALAILIIIVVGHYYIKNATDVLKMMIKPVNDIGKGNFDSPLPEVHRSDEVAQLRDALDEMQYSLSSYVNELKQQH